MVIVLQSRDFCISGPYHSIDRQLPFYFLTQRLVDRFPLFAF
jgi:hypothetical protein